MNKIKFNNTEFIINNYNKTTYFNGDTINSSASCTIIVDNVNNLNTIGAEDIDTIQILHNDTVIYNLQDADAHISNINEHLNNEQVYANIHIVFGKLPESEAYEGSEEPYIEEEPI